MNDILCADLLAGCEGTGFWPGDTGIFAYLAAGTFVLALAVFAYRYLAIRREMAE